MLLEPVAQLLVRRLLDGRAHLGVPQLRLGLTLELRVAKPHGHDRGQAFTDVLPEKTDVLVLHHAFGARVPVDRVGEGLLETLFVHTALGGGDVVRERVDALVEPGVPLHRDLDLARLGLLLERDDALEERILRGVEVLDEVDEAARVLVRLLELRVGALVGETDLETLVEEGHLAQPLEDRLGAELGLLEDGRVGPEGDGRAGLLRRLDASELALGLAALRELLHPAPAVAVDLHHQAAGQRVDDRDADAVQSAGDLVTIAAELRTRVQRGHDDLGRGLVPVLAMVVDRDATTVVGHATTAVCEQCHVDPRGFARHRLVDRVVDDLVHEVVQSGRTRRSDVHARALAHGLEALEHGDVLGRIRHARRLSGRGSGRVRFAPTRGWNPAKLLVRTPKPLSSVYQTTSPGTAFPEVICVAQRPRRALGEPTRTRSSRTTSAPTNAAARSTSSRSR